MQILKNYLRLLICAHPSAPSLRDDIAETETTQFNTFFVDTRKSALARGAKVYFSTTYRAGGKIDKIGNICR